MRKKIVVLGLGYVGVTTCACFSHLGFSVIGVDSDPSKVASVAEGRSPIIEARVEELLSAGLAEGRLSATVDVAKALSETDLAIVCVGTPSDRDGRPDLSAVRKVAAEIGAAFRSTRSPRTTLLRSTVPPGTCGGVFIPALQEASGAVVGDDLRVIYHPEFLREGVSVSDFLNPPKIVFGASNPDWAEEPLALYEGISAPRFIVGLQEAEFIKYMDNPWHALKIGFANELSRLAQACDVDVREVFEMFLADRKLNVSDKYLRPGFAFGGSCLPKDLRAVTSLARRFGVDLPIIDSILRSNAAHLHHSIDRVLTESATRIGVWGLAFKHGTDDIRESGAIELVRQLIGLGRQVRIYDQHVRYAALIGRNKNFADRNIAHLSDLMVDKPAELFDWAELIVVTTDDPEARLIKRSHSIPMIDLSSHYR